MATQKQIDYLNALETEIVTLLQTAKNHPKWSEMNEQIEQKLHLVDKNPEYKTRGRYDLCITFARDVKNFIQARLNFWEN